MLAAQGLVGIVCSNTRPLMPPPGGAERIVGNNPIAIALPSKDEVLVTDMAMSATAMGKIRLADSAGRTIPEGWAADAEGRPTTDPAAAIKGMLLPAAGPKGFGLALAIDLLCGGLSGGAITDEVNPLYGNPGAPYRCSHFFLALDPAAYGVQDLPARVSRVQERTRNAKRAPGADTIYAPGDLERARRAANAHECPLPPEVMNQLQEAERKLS
jgi:LDH2 family malate/lactate/ureidoglycolate dehydrogenase